MIKIRISYEEQQDKHKVIAALQPLKIIKISKEQRKKEYKNVYVDLE